MTLPGPDVTHRWQAVRLLTTTASRSATSRPYWTRSPASQSGRYSRSAPLAPTGPSSLVSAGEEGDTVRVLFAKTLVDGAPAMAADRELSEEQERSCTATMGFPTPGPTRQAASPPMNPGPPNRPWRLAYLSLRRSRCPSAHPMWLLGSPRCLLRRQRRPPKSRCQPAAVPCSGCGPRSGAPIPASAVAPALGRVDEPVAKASVTNDGLVATRQSRVTDRRVGAGAAAAVALAVGIWRRERIGRQVSTTVSRLGTIPATITRRRRRRRAAGPQPGGDRSRPADHGAGPGDGHDWPPARPCYR